MARLDSGMELLNGRGEELIASTNNMAQSIISRSNVPSDLELKLPDTVSKLIDLSSELRSGSKKAVRLAKIYRDRALPKGVDTAYTSFNESVFLGEEGNAAVTYDSGRNGQSVTLNIDGTEIRRGNAGEAHGYDI